MSSGLEASSPPGELERLGIERREAGRRISSLRIAIRLRDSEYHQLATSIEKQRQEHTATLERRRDQVTAEIQQLGPVRQSALAATEKEVRTAQAASDQAFGSNLVADLEAMWDLMAENSTARWICLGLTLLLISLDVAPIAAKLMAPRGPYDAALEAEEAAAIVQQDATVRFHAQVGDGVFTEALRMQHRCRAIEKAPIAYMEVAASFSNRLQVLTADFQERLQSFERAARRSAGHADARDVDSLVTELDRMFCKARMDALAEFAARMRGAFA